ncbi:MAG TPA: hypothetical protein VF814_00685 [Casimicrobiaceae bacterium]
MCRVVVTIANCQISAEPESIEIGKENRDVELQWDIATAGFAFSDEGIVVNDDPGREFRSPRKPQPTKFLLNDRHTFAKDYKYTVNVKASSACPALTADPWVVNN